MFVDCNQISPSTISTFSHNELGTDTGVQKGIPWTLMMNIDCYRNMNICPILHLFVDPLTVTPILETMEVAHLGLMPKLSVFASIVFHSFKINL